MAYYDTETAGYWMEEGIYRICAGNSSRNTKLCGTICLDQPVQIRHLKNICSGWDFEDFHPDRTSEADDVLKGVLEIRLCAEKLAKETVIYEPVPDELPDTGKHTWQEVLDRKVDIDAFVGGLTEHEMAYLCIGRIDENGLMGSFIGSSAMTVAGAAGETTAQLEELGVPALVMADGPAGIRISPEYKVVKGHVKPYSNSVAGLTEFMEPEQLAQMASMVPKPSQEELDAPLNYHRCTAIPIGTSLAQSWNLNVCRECGDLVGEEMETFGIHLWLAPAMNIQRSPLCGRDFEYYSEDPLVSGLIAAAITEGVQAHKGCGVTIKHFACNNQETNRRASNSIVSERALREIYLKGFEICVKKAQPHAVMSSYNLINGRHSCNSKDIQTCVLRNEWGYRGVVMTDWFAANDIMEANGGRENKHPAGSPSGCVKAGNDIVMPGMQEDLKGILGALNGEDVEYPLTKAELQMAAKRVLETVLKLA